MGHRTQDTAQDLKPPLMVGYFRLKEELPDSGGVNNNAIILMGPKQTYI